MENCYFHSTSANVPLQGRREMSKISIIRFLLGLPEGRENLPAVLGICCNIKLWKQYYKVLFTSTKRKDKKLLLTNWIFIYLLSKLLQKTVYDIFILLILWRAVFVTAKEHPEYSKIPFFKTSETKSKRYFAALPFCSSHAKKDSFVVIIPPSFSITIVYISRRKGS